ncbi:MAG TPA: hypothetical protein VFQ39_18410, partial [Longimicrobium sp.]|nr:hypothetical protein [Longimicrobium sp.]
GGTRGRLPPNMYRTCIYCSGDLGRNEVVEPFPVGTKLAFDAAKGRLWAVCPRCLRWNLAPIEERWEAVEAAERLFVDARLRVQSENVGLARLPDGTRLIRVGAALKGELAAWRYGDQLVRRRRQYLIVGAAAAAAGIAVVGGAIALTASAGMTSVFNAVFQVWNQRQQRKVIHRIPAVQSPTGKELVLRRWHASGALLRPAGEGIEVVVADPSRKDPKSDGWGKPKYTGESLVLPDADARTFLGRAMVHVNASGASRKRLEGAVGILSGSGSAEEYIRRIAQDQRTLAKRRDMPGRQMAPEGTLALEMALHEEAERRAMEGELTLLEAAWREAEEIAAIADRLAGETSVDAPPAR